MSSSQQGPAPLTRVPTGIPGVDTIIRGGLFKGGIYIVSGVPGAGKTIFANQICFNWVKTGKRALYVTLLAETHGRMLAQMRELSFFDASKLGTQMKYLNGFNSAETSGLEGLLGLLRTAVRDHNADLLVLDGMLTASALAKSSVDYKKFINELQTWVAMLGCTVLFLTSTSTPLGEYSQPEHTIVDGIFDLRIGRLGVIVERQFTVAKFRASGFVEGTHTYVIDERGLNVFPRLEANVQPRPPGRGNSEKIKIGIRGLDKILGGGVARGSSTVLFGPSGVGKTILGLQYLVHGSEQDEQVIHLGFFERPRDLTEKGDRLGLEISRRCEQGQLHIIWKNPAEQLLDQIGYELLEKVDATGATRVFIDGLAGMKHATSDKRFPGFFATLVEELATRGVTVMMTEESRELFVQEVEIPTPGVSAIFHNIFFLRHLDDGPRGLRRILTVMKTRDSDYDRRPHEFEITGTGVRMDKPLRSAGFGISAGRRGKR